MKYDLGKALLQTHGDRKRAASLLDDAHDELTHAPTMKALFAEVSGFRAQAFLPPVIPR